MRDATVDDLQALHAKAKAARSRFEPDWYLNLAFFEGEQWVGWDGNNLFRPRLRSDRVTIVDNRILPVVTTEVAKLTKNRPVYYCTPRTGDDEDVAAAELAEKLLEFLWDHLGMSDRFTRALLWSRITGAGFLKVVWDKALGDSTDVLVGADGSPLLDAAQRPISGKLGDVQQIVQSLGFPPDAVSTQKVSRGDIAVAVRSPFQILPDPLAETFADLEWLIEESVVSEGYVRERYGVRIAPDTDANPGMVQARLGGAAGSRSGGYRGVKLFEFWRRPSEERPNGYRAVWAGRQLLEVDPEPFDPMPYVMLSGVPVPGRFWPTSIVEQLRGPQTELNKVKSQICESRNRIGNPTVLVSRTAAGDPEELQRQIGLPGGVVLYDDTGPNSVPTYLPAPSMPVYVLDEIDRAEASIREIAGQHEVTSAQVPAGVTAASAINLLQEADDTRIGPAVADMERQLGEAGRKQLRLVARYYDDQRTIVLGAENQAWEIFDFRGQMLRDHTHVDVQGGSTFPRSIAAKQAAMQQILTVFLQNGVPMKEQNLARFLRDYQAGGLEHLIAQFTEDQEQINRENRQLARGTALPVNDYDADAAHIEGHTTWQKSMRYERLPDQARAVFEAHVQAHRDRLAAQQQQLAQQQLAQQLATRSAPGASPTSPAPAGAAPTP